MIKPNYYRLEEAAERSKQTVNALIHFGATGKLPVYLLLQTCYPKVIFEHDTTAPPPEDFRIIDPEGRQSAMYRAAVGGPQRVTTHSLQQYENGAENVAAGLDWNQAMGIEGGSIRRWFYPDPVICLSSENMVIMAADMGLLMDVDDEKPIGTRERNTLYAILDAALTAAKIDISQPYKAAEVISSLTADASGTPKVGTETIANHLKNILKASRP